MKTLTKSLFTLLFMITVLLTNYIVIYDNSTVDKRSNQSS
jgi:hypothetical protein